MRFISINTTDAKQYPTLTITTTEVTSLIREVSKMPTTWELCCGKEDDQMEDQERQEPADKKPNYLELPDVTGYIRQIILSPSTILKITIFVSGNYIVINTTRVIL